MMRMRVVVTAAISAGLLLSACSSDQDPSSRNKQGSSRPKATTAKPLALTTPGPARPAPRGRGNTKLRHDVNGDGFNDLLLRSQGPVTVLYGSKRGLDPELRSSVRGHWSSAEATDLNHDGYADIFGYTYRPDAKDGTPETLSVLWGGAKGPDPKAEPIPLRDGGAGGTGLQPGDFNGDGTNDLVLTGQNGGLTVLYGPFTNQGAPARTATRKDPLHGDPDGRYGPSEIEYLAGSATIRRADVNGDRADDLMVHQEGDGEQTPTVILYGGGDGPGGFAKKISVLPNGNAQAVGDFDGDDKPDVLIADDGSRNNEIEEDGASEGDPARTRIFYGRAPSEPVSLNKKTDPSGSDFRTADLDGDGIDELVSTDRVATTVYRGRRSGPSRKDSYILRRSGPLSFAGSSVERIDRNATLHALDDFDGDGSAETVLNWGAVITPEAVEAAEGRDPNRWWVFDGQKEQLAFYSRPFTTPSPN